MPNDKELDMLFGEQTTAKNELQDLQDKLESEQHGFNEQISTHSMNDKSVIDVVKEKVEEFKEYNNLIKDPHDELISTKNSDRVLPDELSKEDDIPISSIQTEGIHDADNTECEEKISTHNSDRALPDVEKPVTTHTEEINVISTTNSSKFVDPSLN